MELIEVKRKLRQLRALETKVRFQNQPREASLYLWNAFFDLSGKRQVRYSTKSLVSMSREEFHSVVDEYLAYVYGSMDGSYHLDLSKPSSFMKEEDVEAMKKKFRALVKQYHPDAGGDPEKFMQVMREYHDFLKKDAARGE